MRRLLRRYETCATTIIDPVDEPKGFRHSLHCRRDERYAPLVKGVRKAKRK
jgi:hypothetical protein